MNAILQREVINETNWSVVEAKAQAMLVLHYTGLREKSMTEQARFLMKNLGLARADAAALLGTTDDSLYHLLKPASPKKKKAKSSDDV